MGFDLIILNNNNYFSKLILKCLLSLILILIGQKVYAASITGVSCSAPSASTSWPRNTFNSSCNVSVDITGESNVKIGIKTTNTSTAKLSGNGNNLDYTSPEQRFKSEGMSVSTSPSYVATNITSSGSSSIGVSYITYEADYGDTQYQQDFTFGLYRTSDNAELSTYSTSITFTIANKQYIMISTAPTISLTGSAQVYSDNQFYDANSFTATVKANNTWKLQTKLVDLPTDGPNNIPISSIYYKCDSDALNYDCLYTSRTQVGSENTFYDLAQNNNGDYFTGTSDNINLSGKNITVTYSLKTSEAFLKGNFSTENILRVISPR